MDKMNPLANTSKLHVKFILFLCIGFWLLLNVEAKDSADYPEGYFTFEQSTAKRPPKVRKPPYDESQVICEGVLEAEVEAEKSLQNLCGDLNDGYLPINPMGQEVYGQTYPFEVIKNSTLSFFSKTLPILKEDKTLPKVAKYKPSSIPFRAKKKRRRVNHFGNSNRIRRSTFEHLEGIEGGVPEAKSGEGGVRRAPLQETFSRSAAKEEGRSGRSICETNNGMLCSIYNTFMGRRFRDTGAAQRRNRISGNEDFDDGVLRPLTPCPSTVEYVTPVFARNYQGVWRYVVQIPYEGYFTQTVETTQCLGSRCHYMSGSCLASPRWVSLLVAEIFYPDALFPTFPQKPSSLRTTISGGNNSPPPTRRGQFRHRQGARSQGSDKQHCDGRDVIGCFQVRLYYDWFLIPGSCKCWKQDYLAQFAFPSQAK